MTVKQAAIGLLLMAGLIWAAPTLAPDALAAATQVSAVGSIAEMRALDGAGNPVVQVLSYYAGQGKGGGLFVWTAAATEAEDNCVSFAPKSAAKGRWLRQLSGALEATMCGAWWDNSHDDAAMLTRAFAVASSRRVALSFPGGTSKVCSSVTAARAVSVRGQGMATLNDPSPSPTIVNGSCMKSGWVFDLTTPKGVINLEAPKYYDMEVQAGGNNNPGGCIRWNRADGGFTDSPESQYYMLHPHAERIYCNLSGNKQVGLECSKCFDGDFSQNNINNGKNGIALEGSDVMCIGCAGPNRISYSGDSLIRMQSHGTFGNMDRIVGNELLYPQNTPPSYDSFIYDATRSSTIEANHIEGIVEGVQSVIHVVGGFSHTIQNNDLDVLTQGSRVAAAPHWLVAEGPFVNFNAFNNGCGGCILGPALFKNHSVDFNAGGVRQIITHGGNAVNGDAGFPR
jgi:hypothetical protein